MSTSSADDLGARKLQGIRTAAVEAFLLYGFKRTSMEDIAQRAGMSRAALYLHFRNKTDVFRSVTEGVYEEGLERFAAALDPDGDVAETVAAAFLAKDAGLTERVLASPHGAEIMGMGQEAAADIARSGESRLAARLARYLGETVRRRGLSPRAAPEEIAEFAFKAYGGLTKTGAAGGSHRRGVALLGQSVAALLGA
ncbi:TetR family transcriptional regulator [Rhodobacterales bacterium HKCCE3408]|nr:TetR family transcriptional regulator [Rhodobacterales bacterium HKCCE3408]